VWLIFHSITGLAVTRSRRQEEELPLQKKKEEESVDWWSVDLLFSDQFVIK
jgi:hypothetical protein